MAADPQDFPVSQEPPNESRRFPLAFLAGIVAVLVLLGVVWLVSSRQALVTAPPPLPFGENEQKQAQRVRFTDIQMSRATNFLGHQVTIISGYVENMGTETIGEMSLIVEFRDFADQVVLREDVRLLGKMEPPLLGGRRTEFQFNFEKMPPSWNQQHPQFHITGLALQQ